METPKFWAIQLHHSTNILIATKPQSVSLIYSNQLPKNHHYDTMQVVPRLYNSYFQNVSCSENRQRDVQENFCWGTFCVRQWPTMHERQRDPEEDKGHGRALGNKIYINFSSRRVPCHLATTAHHFQHPAPPSNGKTRRFGLRLPRRLVGVVSHLWADRLCLCVQNCSRVEVQGLKGWGEAVG